MTENHIIMLLLGMLLVVNVGTNIAVKEQTRYIGNVYETVMPILDEERRDWDRKMERRNRR